MATQEELRPANWLVESNNGSVLTAVNTFTGTRFTGTPAEYNAMLAQKPLTGVEGGDYDTLRIR